MLKNVVAERAPDQSPAHAGPPRPHSLSGFAIGSAGLAGPSASLYPVSLERQLSQLQRRSRDVLGHRLIQNPAAAALRGIGQMLLANIRRIQELNREANVADMPHDRAAGQMQDLIRSSHRLLDLVVSQIALCDSTTRETLAVAECGQRLLRQEPLKLYKLLPLFDRICDEIGRLRELRLLLPLPGIPLAALVESQSGQADAANFVVGVTTARVLVWMFGDDRRRTPSLARLVLAALLQDVGRLPVTAGGLSARVLRGKRSEWLEEQHPTIGAALFGSIRGAPIELPMLVAQHHEQLDGGGFPRALPARDISPDSAVLAAAVRFAQLCLGPDGELVPDEILTGINSRTGNSRSIFGKSLPARAAEELLSEAEWGKWSLDFSRRLAQSIAETEAIGQGQPCDESDPAGNYEAGNQAAGNREIETAAAQAPDANSGDRLLQLHDQEQALQGTHADAALRHAGTTLRDGTSRFENGAV